MCYNEQIYTTHSRSHHFLQQSLPQKAIPLLLQMSLSVPYRSTLDSNLGFRIAEEEVDDIGVPKKIEETVVARHED